MSHSQEHQGKGKYSKMEQSESSQDEQNSRENGLRSPQQVKGRDEDEDIMEDSQIRDQELSFATPKIFLPKSTQNLRACEICHLVLSMGPKHEICEKCQGSSFQQFEGIMCLLKPHAKSMVSRKISQLTKYYDSTHEIPGAYALKVAGDDENEMD